MGKYPAPPPLPAIALSAADQARVLGKLRRLELEVMFTPSWSWGFQHDLRRWESTARRGSLLCSDVPMMAEWFERFGID